MTTELREVKAAQEQMKTGEEEILNLIITAVEEQRKTEVKEIKSSQNKIEEKRIDRVSEELKITQNGVVEKVEEMWLWLWWWLYVDRHSICFERYPHPIKEIIVSFPQP